MDDRYYDNLQRVNTGFGKPRFSKKEILDILVSVIALGVAFTVLYRNNTSFLNYFTYTLGEDMKYIGLFGLCLVLVVVSFLFHEFGHKFVAQKHGLWSEFRMWPAGLFLTLITPLIGFLFAAPGAVMIAGNMDSRTYGKISIAGPIVNIVMSLIGIIGCFAINHSGWVLFFYMLAQLNGFLAIFNLLPIPPLDGSKILTWNKIVWGGAIAIAALELITVMYYLPDLYWA
jgi:Zn-dependent protease